MREASWYLDAGTVLGRHDRIRSELRLHRTYSPMGANCAGSRQSVGAARVFARASCIHLMKRIQATVWSCRATDT